MTAYRNAKIIKSAVRRKGNGCNRSIRLQESTRANLPTCLSKGTVSSFETAGVSICDTEGGSTGHERQPHSGRGDLCNRVPPSGAEK